MDKYFNNNICCYDVKKIIFDYLFQMILIKKINKLNNHINVFEIKLTKYIINRNDGITPIIVSNISIDYKININFSTKITLYIYNCKRGKLYFIKKINNELYLYDFKTRMSINFNNF